MKVLPDFKVTINKKVYSIKMRPNMPSPRANIKASWRLSYKNITQWQIIYTTCTSIIIDVKLSQENEEPHEFTHFLQSQNLVINIPHL